MAGEPGPAAGDPDRTQCRGRAARAGGFAPGTAAPSKPARVAPGSRPGTRRTRRPGKVVPRWPAETGPPAGHRKPGMPAARPGMPWIVTVITSLSAPVVIVTWPEALGRHAL